MAGERRTAGKALPGRCLMDGSSPGHGSRGTDRHLEMQTWAEVMLVNSGSSETNVWYCSMIQRQQLALGFWVRAVALQKVTATAGAPQERADLASLVGKGELSCLPERISH